MRNMKKMELKKTLELLFGTYNEKTKELVLYEKNFIISKMLQNLIKEHNIKIVEK